MKVIFFRKQNDFRKWLEKNHNKEKEILVGYYKMGSNKPSMTWSESVDQALCFGWIDGVRRSIDTESYCNRFTPRKNTSNWSAINIKKVKELKKLGLITTAGLKAFTSRTEHRSKIYSYENVPVKLEGKYEKQFKLNKTAWSFFNAQAPFYQKITIHWIMNAKQEKTRLVRLEKTIKASSEQKRINY